jgi:predicted dehydrogenase
MLLTGDFGLGGWIQMPPPPARTSFIQHAIRVLRGEEQPISTVEDARTNLAVCLAIYAAARTGREVRVAEMEAAR